MRQETVTVASIVEEIPEKSRTRKMMRVLQMRQISFTSHRHE